MMIHIRPAVICVVTMMSLLSGCTDQGIDMESPPAVISFSQQVQPIFNGSCTGCHGVEGDLSLTAGASYGQLVNITAQSSCTQLVRVLPLKADSSVLYLKLSGSSCGSRMPQGGSLSQTDIDRIRDWINEGAANN